MKNTPAVNKAPKTATKAAQKAEGHVISFSLNDEAYALLQAHAFSCGDASPEEAALGCVASHVAATLNNYYENECTEVFGYRTGEDE